VVRAGHVSPDHAYRLTIRELSCYWDGESTPGRADSGLAALQQAVRFDERRRLLNSLTVEQRVELARWKQKLCN
jgi:hypothetical protein